MKKKITLFIVTIAIVLSTVAVVKAVNVWSLSGWAWSSTIGWISLSSVTVDPNTGNMEGYGWTPNVGWLKFGGLSSFPVPASNGGVNANLNINTGEVKGWARFCAGTVTGDCSTMQSRTDGWDGWLELSGINHTSPTGSGVKYDKASNKITGYAWGGPVVGWVHFNDTLMFNEPSVGVSCSSSVVGDKVRFTATGSGASDYKYYWDNDGASDSNKKEVAMPALNGTVTATVKVKGIDGDGNIGTIYSAEALCSYTNTGGGLITTNPSCQINGSTGPFTGTPPSALTFTIGQASPAGEYEYKLYLQNDSGFNMDLNNSSGLYESIRSISNSYVSASGYPRIVITNKNNSNHSQSFTCPSVTIRDPSLSLYVGGAGESDSVIKSSAKQELTKIRKGRQFKLVWDNTLPKYNQINNPDGYRCKPAVEDSKGGTNSTLLSSWTGNVSESGSQDKIPTPETGKYVFSIKCESDTLEQKTSSVIIQIIDPTGTEF